MQKLTLEVLYEKYRVILFKEAYVILKNKYLAEDAVQQSFLKIIKYIDIINKENEPRMKNFLKIICRNTAKNIIKKQSKIQAINITIDDIEERADADSKDPLNIVIDKESVNRILKAIEDLPEIYRDVIELKSTYKYSNKEIAELLDISDEALKKRLYRARKILSQALERNESHNG